MTFNSFYMKLKAFFKLQLTANFTYNKVKFIKEMPKFDKTYSLDTCCRSTLNLFINSLY